MTSIRSPRLFGRETPATAHRSNKHILYIHPGTELYGSDRMAVETVRALVDAGYSVTVIVPSDGPLVDYFSGTGADVRKVRVPVLRKEYLSPRRISGLAVRSIRALGLARKQILESKAGLVYVNTIIQPVWMIAARLARVPLICHVREAEKGVSAILRAGLTSPASLANLLISNSRTTEQFVLKSSIRRPRNHRVIYNGKTWDPYFTAPPAPITGSPRILVIGRLSPRKGQHVAVEAIGLLAAEGIHVTLELVGDTFVGYEWYAKELKDRAEHLKIADQCDFVGFSDHVEKNLAAADIVVVPSLTEPFGTVAAEAMAAMRPTIASRTEGLEEIIEHGRTGLLVQPGNATALADAIRRLLQEPALADSLARSGYHAVRERFSAATYRESIISAARELLEGAG